MPKVLDNFNDPIADMYNLGLPRIENESKFSRIYANWRSKLENAAVNIWLYEDTLGDLFSKLNVYSIIEVQVYEVSVWQKYSWGIKISTCEIYPRLLTLISETVPHGTYLCWEKRA